MKELTAEISKIANEYIAKGLTAEEVCGCLAGVSFRVMQASLFTVPAEAESGGGSPVQKVFDSSENPGEN